VPPCDSPPFDATGVSVVELRLTDRGQATLIRAAAAVDRAAPIAYSPPAFGTRSGCQGFF